MDLSELTKLIKLMRKQGVESLELNGTKITLAPASGAPQPRRRAKTRQSETQTDDVDTEEMTDEQILFWSTGGDLPFTVEDKKAT